MGEPISVVIPTFDRSERLLGEAIDSVLAQTVGVDEIVVVDDGSTEPVAGWIADRYGDDIITLRQPNLGIGAARNRGIARATGSLLAFIDSDDIWMPDKLERQLAVFAAEPDVDAVFGRAEQFHDEQTSPEHRARFPIEHRVIDAWLSTAMLIRREAFVTVGEFWLRPGAVDVDWTLRARQTGIEMRMLDAVVYRRRVHEANFSIANSDTKNSQLVEAVRADIARRRAASQ